MFIPNTNSFTGSKTHENVHARGSGHPLVAGYENDLLFTDPHSHYHLSHDQRNPQDIGAFLHDHEGDPALKVCAALAINHLH